MGLIVELHRERADDLAGEAVAADLGEEAVDVLGGVLLVLGEDLDEVLERLGLELVELLALRGVGLALRVGDLEDADEALGGLVAAAETPHAPRALEQREPVELAVLELEDLLVLDERRLRSRTCR